MRQREDRYKQGYKDGVAAARGWLADDDGEPLTMDAIREMDADMINARWDDILPVLEADHAQQ